MWWKIASVVLVIYVLVAGMRVPLKPGIVQARPYFASICDTVIMRCFAPAPVDTAAISQTRYFVQYDPAHKFEAGLTKSMRDSFDLTCVRPTDVPDSVYRKKPVVLAKIEGAEKEIKSKIEQVNPYVFKTGDTVSMRFWGYNTFFNKEGRENIRIWLRQKDSAAVAAQRYEVLNDTILDATFIFPQNLPDGQEEVELTAIVDHPTAGEVLLPGAVELQQSKNSSATVQTDTAWYARPIENLNVPKGFSFPYQNILYETIRNLYYHVPMWFALMFLFVASVVYSVRFLMNPKLDFDRKAAAYAEVGLLFGGFGLVTGMLWAQYTWGVAWSNDIKQLMTAVALLIYLAYFILRRSFDEPEKGARLAAVYNIFAFASLIPLLYVVPRMFASLHPGATGNPAFGSQDLDNTMRMVFYPAILGFTGLGFWIAELRIRYQRLADSAMGLD